jgi:hypothetical protein
MTNKSRTIRNKFIKEMIKQGINKEEIRDIFHLTRMGLYNILKKKK